MGVNSMVLIMLSRCGAIHFIGMRWKIWFGIYLAIIPEYIIDIKNKSKKTLELVEHYEKLKNLEQQKKENKVIDIKESKKFIKKKNYRKKKFFKKAK